MKANYKIRSGQLVFEVVGNQAKDIWAQVAQIQSLFEAESVCGICGCKDLRYHHFVDKNNYHYYKLVCLGDDTHQFKFGQRKDTGELFPNRDKGWHIYSKHETDPDEGNFEPEPPRAQQPQQPPRPPAGPPPAPRAPQPQQAPAPRPQSGPQPPAPRPQSGPQPPRQAPPPPAAGQRQSARDLQYERDHDHDFPPDRW